MCICQFFYIFFHCSFSLSRPRRCVRKSKDHAGIQWIDSLDIYTNNIGKRSKRTKRDENYNNSNNNRRRFLIHAFNPPSWSSCLFLLVFYFDELQHMTDWPINRYTSMNVLESLDTFKLFDLNKSICVDSGPMEASQRQRVLYSKCFVSLFRSFLFCFSANDGVFNFH